MIIDGDWNAHVVFHRAACGMTNGAMTRPSEAA